MTWKSIKLVKTQNLREKLVLNFLPYNLLGVCS